MHTPFRTCIGCRQRAPQYDLLRIALEDGEPPWPVVDVARTHPGRGAWLHRSDECLALAITKNALSRAFRCRVQPGDLAATASEAVALVSRGNLASVK